MISRLKYYYTKTISTDWIRYMVYILLAIIILFVLYTLFNGNEYMRLDSSHTYKVKEAKNGVALDGKHFYAISNSCIGKYSRKTGKKVLSKQFPFKNISGGTFVNGDLVVINNSSKSGNILIWLDPDTLDIIDTMPVPQVSGTLSWIDWAWDKWWVCDAFFKKNVKETSIYCFNQDWVLEGYWKLPKSIVNEIKPESLLGGAWFGEYLCVMSNDNPEMYILELPEHSLYAKLVKKVQVCFDGRGFALERGKGNVYAWGVQNGRVVRCAIKGALL